MIKTIKGFGTFRGFNQPCSPSALIALMTGLCWLEQPPHKSVRSLTVDMTVDAHAGKHKARIYAGFRPSEIIEWE